MPELTSGSIGMLAGLYLVFFLPAEINKCTFRKERLTIDCSQSQKKKKKKKQLIVHKAVSLVPEAAEVWLHKAVDLVLETRYVEHQLQPTKQTKGKLGQTSRILDRRCKKNLNNRTKHIM